ncbi:mandelate racemase/muconate lactonizing enzyme family protein [Spiractinospora alimapuensis]|uniref:mandelate racemase/muconate lactonizing enzyme family protein n=1 Tax=Spiractinospora alimapuensis TaxID=2820884 RepID=UPI001F232376|nr:mandelate racemase/muconate lactonizing enzyme family protein [Spiractinospora alimapuensis]QVQ53511.1 mandelate racemase/muconate lactonizing enzyme family protein [Spiractinospora alimapuensis]
MTSRIRAVEAIPLSHPLHDAPYGSARGLVPARQTTLVRVETDDGVVGWGESFGPTTAMVPLVREIAAPLPGVAVTAPVPFVTAQLQQHYHRGGGLHAAAVSGIEIALWDVLGRQLGVGVATLLGGQARDHVVPYASAGYARRDRDLDLFAAELADAVDGMRGAKIKCGFGVVEDRERARAARAVLGDGALMVDLNGNYTADQARASAEAMAETDMTWLEEPLAPDDVDGLPLLRALGVPLATGEALYTRAPFRRLVAERLVDLVQPDVTKVGGLFEAKAICELARTWGVRVSPHVWGGGVALAATVQLLASVPDTPHTDHAPDPLWLELDRGDNALRERLLTSPFRPTDGRIDVPTGPGLGVEVDERAVEFLREDT